MKLNKTDLPRGWELRRIGDLGKIVSGGTPSTENTEFWNGNIPWLTPTEVSNLNTRFISNTKRKITKLGLKNSSAKILPAKSIIICSRASVGNICINTCEMTTNQGFKSILPSEYNSDFIFYLLSFKQNEIIKKACGSTFLEISKSDLEKIKIPVPPIGEQERIAELLSCWDKAIEDNLKIISLKEKRKKALMQSLLSGKFRLKGFSAPWKTIKLGEVLFEHKTKSQGKEEVFSVSVHKGLVNQVSHLGRSFAAKDISNYNLVKYYDIVYTKSPTGDFPYGIIKQSYVDKNVIVSPLYGVFTPLSKDLGIVLDAYFEYPVLVANLLMPIIQKGAKNTISITNSTFLKGKFKIPTDSKEIECIAKYIEMAREEISLYKKKVELLKKQKKYLMQVLLTGEKRLKG